MQKMSKISWNAIPWASLCFLAGVQSFVIPCIYQSDKCGFTLATLNGYTNAELIAAVNQTSTIPPLNTSQLLQVIYHCQDINGNIVGNSFCEEGCLANSQATQDDQCKLSGTTTTVTVTTTAPISCYKKCQTICFGGGCGIFQETTVPNTQTMTPLLTF